MSVTWENAKNWGRSTVGAQCFIVGYDKTYPPMIFKKYIQDLTIDKSTHFHHLEIYKTFIYTI